MDAVYGVIAEFKDEGPIIMEGYPADYDTAAERMNSLKQQANVIRVAIFRAEYVSGNQTLLPKSESKINPPWWRPCSLTQIPASKPNGHVSRSSVACDSPDRRQAALSLAADSRERPAL